jgi:hypothetical protein
MKHTSDKSLARPACTSQMDKNDIEEAQTHVSAQKLEFCQKSESKIRK